MISNFKRQLVPRDVERALRRLLKTLQSAPAEIQVLGQAIGGGDYRAVRASALEQIADWLYLAWYTALRPAEETIAIVPGRDNLAPALRASIAASTRWETGWVAMRTGSSGICLAGHGNQSRELRPGEYVNLARHGMPVAPGDHLAVTEMMEWIDAPTGFWCARSWSGEPQGPLVRIYFSARYDQVGFVLMDATATLDRLGISYSLKCSTFASVYSRVDSLIVYLEADSWPRLAVEIKALGSRLKPHLRNSTPPLTKKLAQGIAFAEDLGMSESFGENRCKALASGVLALLQDHPSSTDEGLDILIQSLRTAGIDTVRPWVDGVHHEHR